MPVVVIVDHARYERLELLLATCRGARSRETMNEGVGLLIQVQLKARTNLGIGTVIVMALSFGGLAAMALSGSPSLVGCCEPDLLLHRGRE